MAIQFGNDKIKDIYVGSDKIKEVYYGSELVWGEEVEPIQGGYWVHKDTGVKTYFDADADFITNGIMSSPSWRDDCSEVQIPSGVTSLGLNCFFDSASLTSITLPEGVTSIEGYCFYNCSSLALITVLPTIPPTLGGAAFSFTHPSLSIKVQSPYVNAYKAATNWNQYAAKILGIQDGYWVNKYSGVKTYFWLDDPSIADGIMSSPSWRNDCSEVNIPVGVTSLGDECFYEAESLTSVTLPEGVTSLEEACFEGCTSLTSVTLPESVTSIGGYCFSWCKSLTLVTVLPATPPTLGTEAFDSVHSSFNIKVRSPYVNAYKASTNWSYYASKISAI